MQSNPFKIVEHVTPCQHIREYPRAIGDEQETTLLLSVKQYIPIDNPNPKPGDVTILGAHANGFPKVQPFPYIEKNLILLYFLALSNVLLGTIRTTMERNSCTLKETRFQDSRHLDSRCGPPRSQWGAK